jgi:peroxiredoxin
MDKNNAAHTERWVEEHLAALNSGEEWQPNVTAAWARLVEKKTRGGWFGRRWALAGVIVVAAVLFAMFLPSPQVLAQRCLECSVAVWQSLSGQNEAKMVGQTAPNFDLRDVNGKEVKLSELKGKVVLVNFWATWCEGCQVEIPWLIEFAKKYGDKGLVVIGVSLDDDGWKSVRPWAEEKKVNYPVVIGSQELGKKYGLEGMPLTTLIGRDGKIADSHGGIVDKEATEKKIQTLLAERTEN